MFRPVALVALLISSSAVLLAQGPDDPPLSEQDRIQRLLVPLDVLMRNQAELGLTPEQESYIREQVRDGTARFTDLRWSLQREMDPLVELLRNRQAEESEILDQLDKVLDLERQIKMIRLQMAIRIKKKLTDAQLSKLEELRRDRPGRIFRSGPNPPREPQFD